MTVVAIGIDECDNAKFQSRTEPVPITTTTAALVVCTELVSNREKKNVMTIRYHIERKFVSKLL